MTTELLEPSPPPAQPLPAFIQRYLDGESITDLAKDLSCARQRIYEWMHSAVGDQAYPDLIRRGLLARMAQADDRLATAATMTDIARAREEAKFSRWDIERRLDLFRPKQELAVDTKITVIVQRSPQPVEKSVVDSQVLTIDAKPHE